MEFKIKGWFAPAIIKSPITNKRYAVCGSNWIEISNEMTIDEITEGWICIANDIPNKNAKTSYPIKNSKIKIAELYKKV